MEAPSPLLLVDDDRNDQELLLAAAEEAGLTGPVVTVGDGNQAIEYLRRIGQQPPPCLVVTDLKMPHCDGFQFLAWLRAQPALRAVPVVVLTASNFQTDHARALSLGARTCLTKPRSYSELIELVRGLGQTVLRAA